MMIFVSSSLLSDSSYKLEYIWNHFNGKKFNLSFEISKPELLNSQKEFGLKNKEMHLEYPKGECSINYKTQIEYQRKLNEFQYKYEQQCKVIKDNWEKNLNNKGFRIISVGNTNIIEPDFRRLYLLNIPRLNLLRYEMSRIASINNIKTEDALLDLMLSFVQEIEYRIPSKYRGEYYTNELLLPLEVLVNKWGDCDSKALLLATLIGKKSRKIILFQGPSHMLIGIEGTPKSGENYYTMSNRDYIVCETSGGMWPRGRIDNKILLEFQKGKYKVIKLN